MLRRWRGSGESESDDREVWIAAEYRRRLAAGFAGNPSMLLVELFETWERRSADPDHRARRGEPGKLTRTLVRYEGMPGSGKSAHDATDVEPVERDHPALGDFFGQTLEADERHRSTAALRIADTDRARRKVIEGQLLEIADVLALDPWGIEVVVDRRATSRLDAAGVRGMQEGTTVYLHPQQYDPSSSEGRYLLAHELVHAKQRTLQGDGTRAAAEAEATSLGRAYARGETVAAPSVAVRGSDAANEEPAADEDKLLASPPALHRAVLMVGIRYRPQNDVKWVGGLDKRKQAYAAFIQDLVGAKYTVALMKEALLARGGLNTLEGQGQLDGNATQDDKVSEFFVRSRVAVDTAKWLVSKGHKITLTAEHLTTLQGGIDVDDTWPDIQPMLPPWFTSLLYLMMMGTSQKTNLTAYGKALRTYNADTSSSDNELALEEIRTKVYKELMFPGGNAVELIRRDTSLASMPAYRVLWKVPAPEKGAAPAEVKVGTDGPVDDRTAAELMHACMSTDKALAEKAATDPAARKKLLENLEVRLKLAKLPTDGDQVMHDGPVKATRPPLSSSMRAWPTLEAPFYDTPKGGDREFVMSLGFPDVFEAFRGYRYRWEMLQIPDDEVKKLAQYEDPREKAAATGDNSALKGAQPGQLDVLGGRLDRDVEDGKTDIKRSIFSLSNLLGPPGTGATTLVTANAMLRMVGTVIRTFIETMTKPSYEKTMPFAKEGLYVVRCTAWPTPNDKSIIDRSPSVAWMPIWVRPAEAMSKLRVHLDSKLKDGAIAQFKAIEEALKDPSMKDPKNKAQREALEKRLEALRVSIWGSGGDQFELEKKNLTEAMNKSTDAAEKKRLKERIEDIDKILEMRKDRLKDAPASGSGLEGTMKMPAAFVADKGHTMRPLLEVFQKKASSGFLYHVVDSTTKNSGHRDGSGATRLEAIKNAVTAIFESDQGYGRGVVTLKVPDRWGIADDEVTIKIDKDGGALQMEAIENIATVASIAAIAAAPFTAGGSLALLVPIGIVGAIPSAYRLLDRAEQGTLRFDMATALDIVNILGAAIGAGTTKAASVAALRGIPLSSGYMILGLGNDGLGFLVAGAAFVEGIAALDKDPTMPKGLRNARIAELVGQQLIQIGMMVGASLATHGKTQVEKFGGKKGDPPVGPRVGPEITAKFHEAVGPKGAEIPVFRDEKGAKVKGGGIEIHFERDGYGLPTDARVVMGPTANEAGLLGHVKATKAVVEYQGFLGWLRNLRDRITVLFKSGKAIPDTKSRAGIAAIEIEKISGLVEKLHQDLGKNLITPEAYGSKLKDYQEQIAKHEKALDDFSKGPGIIAAHDNVAAAAEKAGYPPAPKDHFYYETGDGKFQLERAPTSAEPAKHIEFKEGKPVIVGGEVAGKVYDKTAIKELTKPLGGTVTLHDNATSEKVSVRPKPDGSYEVHYKQGTPEHLIKEAIDRHLELRAERPKDLKNPIKEDGSRWTGADEAAYLGRPTEEGYYWALNDGKLQIVSKDLDAHPKKVWDDKQNKPVVDTGAPKVEPSFPKNGASDAEIRKAKENAFETLGGNDPSTEFGQWVKKCETYLGLSKEDLIARMKNPSDIQHRTVRHGLKENITPDMVKKIALDKSGVANDRAFLKERQPGLYADAKTEADLKKADKAASHAEMLELTKGLGSADRGSIAEQWYKANYAPTAERHVTFDKDAMKKLGIELETTREPDIVGDKKIREVKHTTGSLGERDKAELKDYSKLLDQKIKIGEGADAKTYHLTEMVVVFPEPTGGHANADNIAKLVGDKRVSVEVFNSRGEKHTIDTNDLKKGKFNVDGGEAGLAKAIKEWCK